MTNRPSSTEATTFFVATVALSIATSPISFTLGAYGEIFYTELLTVWVASVAALIASLVIVRTRDGEVYITWWGAVLLLVPSALMLSEVLGLNEYPTLILILEWALLLGAIPYLGYILLFVAAPDTLELRATKFIAFLVVSVTAINLASYSVGYFNAYFFVCDDFERAGDTLPPGCWRSQ